MECLLCRSNHIKRIEKFCSNMKLLGDSFPDTPSYIAVCKECGLVYVDMEVSQKNILSYYTSGNCKPICYENLFGQVLTMQYFEHIYNTAAPFLHKESQILDIGGGLGEFAEFLRQRGHKNITIMDPSDISISTAARKGITAIQADSTEFLPEEEKKYDFIFLIHVFEHIYDQKKTLDNIRRLLKDDGYLYLEVPDASKFCNDDNAPYYYYTYEHVAHMDSYDIKNIANISGMELIDTQEYIKCSHYPSVYGLYKNGNHVIKPVYHESGERNACEYLEISKTRSKKMAKEFQGSGKTLVLWGIGASTAQLINSCFEQCNVKELVDSNPMRQGVSYKIGSQELTIISPEELKNRIHETDTIVVMSIMYKDSITRQIRDMGFTNKVEALSQ